MTKSLRSFDIVVATDLSRGIGKGGTLPWKLSGDLKYFRELTTKVQSPGRRNAVVMGRKTWESIPEKFRPLRDRVNVVLTRDRNYDLPEGVLRAASIDEALSTENGLSIESCFVIGGGEVYANALQHPSCKLIYLTQVRETFDCDTYFPSYEHEFVELSRSEFQREDNVEYCFLVLGRKPG